MKSISGQEKARHDSRALFRPNNPELTDELAETLHISPALAQIMVNRGINTVTEGNYFLNPDPARLHSPFELQDMEAAVAIIWSALQADRKIAVYGDYDVDGIGATATLVTLLGGLGGNIVYYLPNRLTEGYGLNIDALARLAEAGVSLLITVDCGISNGPEVAFARERGLDVVITDHHLPPAELPPASAVLNPHRDDCPYPFKDLCGAGIAFKLGQALLAWPHRNDITGKNEVGKNPWLGMEEYLDLVALATVADQVPLLGENRILVAHGLRYMQKNLRPGLSALCKAASIEGEITSETIAFMIAPRLNAAGRLGDAAAALKLLLAASGEEAQPLAVELHEKNSQRQLLEAEIFEQASSLVGELPENERNFLLLAAPGWHQGVLGIVAGRLLEQHNRPVILLSPEGGEGKGSGRSGPDFNISTALQACAPLLQSFGGHDCAAGLTVKEENISLLRRELNQLAHRWQKELSPAPSVCADACLQPRQITAEMVRELERLEPFGCGNPRPLFYGEEWFLQHKREVGRGRQHLQLGLSRDGCYFPAICFNGKHRLPFMQPLRQLDIFFSLAFDTWRGGDALQLEISAVEYCDEYIRENLYLVDRREITQKLSYLRELGKRGEAYLIFVNTLRRMDSLRRSLAGQTGVYFTHQGKLTGVEADSDPLHLVLYDLPLQGCKLSVLLQRLCRNNSIKVHLLYGSADGRDNLRLLRSTVPSLAVLEQVYFALREMAANGAHCSFPENLGQLRRHLPFSPTTHLLEKCLHIMEESACLKREKGRLQLFPGLGDDYCILLKTLATSDYYNWARKRWQEVFHWQKYMLEATGEELLNLLIEGAKTSTNEHATVKKKLYPL